MAKLGIVCDSSLAGPRSRNDVIVFATEGRPHCFSHVLSADSAVWSEGRVRGIEPGWPTHEQGGWERDRRFCRCRLTM